MVMTGGNLTGRNGMYWKVAARNDYRARLLADRHYSRKKPGTDEFCPPGNNIVLLRLDDDEKRRYNVPTGGGIQSVICISEAGLYSLVLSSRKPAAKDFKRWLTHDVLPAIRKTGSYITSNLTPLQILRQMLDTFEAQNERIDNLDNRVELLEAHVQPELDYYTIMGCCHKHGMAITTNQAISLGQKCKRRSVERNVPVGKIADPRYGEVDTYHISILDEIVGKD